jgi:hypothetical protein
MHEPQRETFHVRGPFRVLSFSLKGRPFFLTHGLYKRMLENEGGRLELAGNPLSLDIDFHIELIGKPLWKGRPVDRVVDLETYDIRSLAPGIVAVRGAYCSFLFYGNAWFQLAQTHRVKPQEGEAASDQPQEDDADGQRRFMGAIQRMEKTAAASAEKPQTKIIHRRSRFPGPP